MLRHILVGLALILTASRIAAAEPQAPSIPTVKTVDDLRKLAPVQLPDGQEVRIGITEAAEGLPWRLIYCLMIDPKGPANDPQGDPEEWLGPLKVRIAEGRDAAEVTGPLDDK